MAGRTGAIGADGRYAGLTYLVGNEANGFQPEPPARRPGRSTSSTCARRTTRPARSRRAPSSSAGSRGPAPTTRSSCSTPPTRRYIADPGAAALDLRDRRRARLRDRAAQLLQARRASPACAARSWSCPRTSPGSAPTASASRSTRCGRAGTRPSSTARRTSCSAAPRRPTRRPASPRPATQIAFYMENARLLRDGLGAAGFTVFGGVHAPYLWLRTPRRRDVVGVLRSPAHRGPGRRHAGRRVRPGGRGLLPAVGVQLAREHRGSDRPDPPRVPRQVTRTSGERTPCGGHSSAT